MHPLDLSSNMHQVVVQTSNSGFNRLQRGAIGGRLYLIVAVHALKLAHRLPKVVSIRFELIDGALEERMRLRLLQKQGRVNGGV